MTQNLPAVVSDYDTGLEDFDPSDAALPRLSIVHDGGTFKDNLSGEEFGEIHGVFLGMIKQRHMWNSDPEDDAKPMCKSSDAETGFPNVTGPDHSLFPWEQSGFTPQTASRDEHNRPVLKCDTCVFAQWTKNGAKNVPPACSERYTFPIRYSSEGEGTALDRSGILSLQRSGITPAKQYLSIFSRNKSPMFSSYTKLKLERKSRGTVKYSTPVFTKGSAVPQEEWEEFAKEYRSIREFLREPPRIFDDSEAASTPQATQVAAAVGNTGGASSTAAPVVPAQRTGSGLIGGGNVGVIDAVVVESSAPADDDDLPF